MGISAIINLEIPKSFEVPSSNISEVKSFEILAEFLRRKIIVMSVHFSLHCIAVEQIKLDGWRGKVFAYIKQP